MVEGARLERGYRVTYLGFESLAVHHKRVNKMSSNFKITVFTLVVMLGVTLISLMTTDTEKKVEISEPHSVEVSTPKVDSNNSQD